MEQPKNYDTTKEPGAYIPPEVGGHYMIIKKVEDTKSKNGDPMLIVYFDFDKDDKQPGFFAKAFKADTRPEKSWPFQGKKWIMRDDTEGNCSRNFKGFISSVEASNPGFNVAWGDNFGEQFKDKRVGGVFGMQYDFYNGKETKQSILRWFCAIEKVKDAEVPDIYETTKYKKRSDKGTQTSTDD